MPGSKTKEPAFTGHKVFAVKKLIFGTQPTTPEKLKIPHELGLQPEPGKMKIGLLQQVLELDEQTGGVCIILKVFVSGGKTHRRVFVIIRALISAFAEHF